MTAIEREIYDRLKHIVDDIYRKKGICSADIRKHFLKPINFKKLVHLMRDLKHIYDENKYPIGFENTVYDILFYRILMDRIYYEKEEPVQLDETFLKNYDMFVEKLMEGTKKTKYRKMTDDAEESDILRMDAIKTRSLSTLVAKYEMRAEKAKDAITAKNYRELAKKYNDELKSREQKMRDDFMKHVDKEGKWIRDPK